MIRLLSVLLLVPALLGAGYENNYPGREPEMRDLWGWAVNKLTDPPIAHDVRQVPWQPVDVARLTQPAPGLRFTWLGHASVLIEVDGLRIVTDPFFSERASPFSWLGPKRQTPLPIAVKDLPHIDVVLISHNHHDHLDPASLEQLMRQAGGPPLVLVPAGDAAWLTKRGIAPVQDRQWWQRSDHVGLDGEAVSITFVPVQHWSRHLLEQARNDSLWGGYVIRGRAGQVLFAGDSGYSADFKDMRQRLGPLDVALLPIGAYLPRPLTQRQHMDPTQALQVHQDVEATLSLPIHWGTLILSNEPIQQPAQDLRTALEAAGVPASAFPVWAIGETRDYP